MLNMFVAMCRSGGIGLRNNLPFHLRSVDKCFHETTIGRGNNAVIMGRKTAMQFPNLPKRDSLILSNSKNVENSFNTLFDIKEFCHDKKYDNVWIIGGEKVFQTCINDKDLQSIFVIDLQADFLCNKYFPPIPFDFYLREKGPCIKGNNIKFRVLNYAKKTSSLLTTVPPNFHFSWDFLQK